MVINNQQARLTKEQVISMTKQLGMMHILYYMLRHLEQNKTFRSILNKFTPHQTMEEVILSGLLLGEDWYIDRMNMWEEQYKKGLKEKNEQRYGGNVGQ